MLNNNSVGVAGGAAAPPPRPALNPRHSPPPPAVPRSGAKAVAALVASSPSLQTVNLEANMLCGQWAVSEAASLLLSHSLRRWARGWLGCAMSLMSLLARVRPSRAGLLCGEGHFLRGGDRGDCGRPAREQISEGVQHQVQSPRRADSAKGAGGGGGTVWLPADRLRTEQNRKGDGTGLGPRLGGGGSRDFTFRAITTAHACI